MFSLCNKRFFGVANNLITNRLQSSHELFCYLYRTCERAITKQLFSRSYWMELNGKKTFSNKYPKNYFIRKLEHWEFLALINSYVSREFIKIVSYNLGNVLECECQPTKIIYLSDKVNKRNAWNEINFISKGSHWVVNWIINLI